MIRGLACLLVVVSVVIFSACQKEITPEDGPVSVTQGAFRAKINGVQWDANGIKTASRQDGVIVLYGTNTDKKSILLRVADSGVHNYSLHSASMSNVGVFTDSAVSPIAFTSNQWNVPGNYGNLTITSIDTVNKTMSGTFSMQVFKSIDSTQRTISDGVFTNIVYSTQPPAPSATDSFRVKVAGVNFSYNLLAGIKAFGRINISASQGSAPTVGLSLPDTISVGQYSFNVFDYIGQYNPSTSVFLAADTGSVTILEHNIVSKRIRGNFHFLANTVFTHLPPNVPLTEGYFSIKYN
jgi:Family of unknown function (DUF6252)